MPRTWLTSPNSNFVQLIRSITLFLLMKYPPHISYKNISSQAITLTILMCSNINNFRVVYHMNQVKWGWMKHIEH